MAKEDTIVMEGVVQDVLPNAMFKVKLNDVDKIVLGHLSGRMRTNNIKVLLGDRVQIEFSPYDISRGRITRRH
jgi:translation initiation factor IF-1